MGKRHGAILESLGDSVMYSDIGQDPSLMIKHGKWDSILICTPAETHSKIIHQIGDKYPIFCEKPIITNIEQYPLLPEISMVACNWRFCRCCGFHMSDRLEDIFVRYPTANALDLIHFLDLFWDFYGQPETIGIKSQWRLIMTKANGKIKQTVQMEIGEAESYYGFREIHHDPESCPMFVRQMKHWRECAGKRHQSNNPFKAAVERTQRLIEVLQKS